MSNCFPAQLNIQPINLTLIRTLPNEVSFFDLLNDSINVDNVEIRTESPCTITDSQYGIFSITPTENCRTIFLEFYYENELVGKQFFATIECPTPRIYSYQIRNKPETGSFNDNVLGFSHDTKTIQSLRELELRYDFNTGRSAVSAKLISFEFQIVREDNIISKGYNSTGVLSDKTQKVFSLVKPGDELILKNITYQYSGSEVTKIFSHHLLIVE